MHVWIALRRSAGPTNLLVCVSLLALCPPQLRQAAENSEKPFVVVLGKDFDQPMRTKQVLMDAGMWFL